MRPVLALLQASLDDADKLVQIGGGEVGQEAAFEQGPDALDRVQVGGVGRELDDSESVSMVGGERLHPGHQVQVEVVPDQHDRGAELGVGGEDQVPVVHPAEGLGLALTAPWTCRR